MLSTDSPFDLPGSPADILGLLDRHRERVEAKVRELQRVAPDPTAYCLMLVVRPSSSDGRRKVNLACVARTDVSQWSEIGPIVVTVDDPAPDGMLHMLVVTDTWTHHTMVPLPSSAAGLS